MKRILLTSILFSAVSFMITGCLKDKGFDNHEYGINDPDTAKPGVGFSKGNKAQTFGLEVSATNQAVPGMVFVALFDGEPAKQPVQVTLVDNTTALLAAYNAVNGTNVLPLPTNLYSLPSMTITVPVGAYNVEVPINVSNTTALDPNKSYAVGYSITAVNGGDYQIAENLKNLLVVFSVKNRLDGVYEITGAALRAGDPVLTGPFGPYETDLVTSGANSVQWEGAVYWGGQLSQLPGGYEPNITVSPVTNLITNITSPNGLVTMTSPIVRADILCPGGNPSPCVQRYDPATKTLYFEFTYGGGPTSRLFSMKAVWLHAR
jgi:hypothetical protein